MIAIWFMLLAALALIGLSFVNMFSFLKTFFRFLGLVILVMFFMAGALGIINW